MFVMTNRRSGRVRRRTPAWLAGLLALALVALMAAPALADSMPAPAPMPLPPAEPGQPGGPALEAPKISREDAIARARAIFDIPADLGDPSVNLWQSSEPRSRPVWSLNWRSPEGSRPMLNYSVGVDGTTGETVNYHFRREGLEQQPPLSLTRREAESRAAEALQKLAGSYVPQLQKRAERLEQFYFHPGAPAEYSFNWERVAEGIPVSSQGVSITIDARTGELMSYNLNWDRSLAFRRTGEPIGLSEAEAIYRAEVPMELAYQRYWDPATEKANWKLVYRTRAQYPFIAADSGDLLDQAGEPWAGTPYADLARLPYPSQPWQPPAEPLSQEQALALAYAATGLGTPPTSASYHESDKPRPTRTFHFSWNREGPGPMKPGERNYDVSIDALTGLIQNFGSWGPGPENPEEAKPAVDRAAAHERAADFIRKFRPDLLGRALELPDDQERYSWCTYPGQERAPEQSICDRYSFQFQLLKGGIPLLGQQASVEVDVWTGQVAGFWGGMDLTAEAEAELPDPAGVITPARAMDSFLQYEGLRLVWHTLYPRPKLLMTETEREPPQPRLLYMPGVLHGSNAVDAFTGHILDGSGRDRNKLAAEPGDIEGHWAQKEIEILLVRGVFELDDDGNFGPAAGVNRGEAARWLVLAKGLRPYERIGQYSFLDFAAGSLAMPEAARAAAPYVEAGLDAGILVKDELGETFDPLKPVSREEFTLWAVRAMGYGAIARMPVQIPVGYTDAGAVGERYRNAVAILAGLGVLSGQGEFRPQDTITRAEAAKILFAVASERRNY